MQDIGSKSGKLNRFTQLLNKTLPDIVIMTEHGLKSGQLENTRLREYTLKTYFCRINHKKGGVAIYVRDDLQSAVESLDITHHNTELNFEAAMLQISLGKEQLHVMGVYRPPSGQLDEALDSFSLILEETGAEKHTTVIMGDINIDCLETNRNSKKLNDMLAGHNITRLTLPPTRVTPTSISSIDFICTNQEQDRLKTSVIHEGISDHTAQLSKIKIKSKLCNNTNTMGRVFNLQNLNIIKETLQQQDWSSVYQAPSAETAYNNFLYTITLTIDATCPVKKIRTKGRTRTKALLNHELKNLKQNFLLCLKRYELTGKDEDRTDMARSKKEYDLKLKTLIKQETAKHIQEAQNKSKAVWQVINKHRKNKTPESSNMELKTDKGTTKNPNEVASFLNLYFTNIAEQTLALVQKTGTDTTFRNTQITGNDLLHLQCTNEHEIKHIIKTSKSKTSFGIDNISSKLLKHCSDSLTPPLVNIINKSLCQGIFPRALKTAKVYPKYKNNGSKKEASNYRPIALLPTFSKIVERVVLQRLMQHCIQNRLLTDGQHAYMEGRSTTTALVKFLEFVIDNLESKHLVSTILVDFSRAFDCLEHNLILEKLKQLGINGLALKWFKSYLEGRQQIVELSYTQKGLTNKVRSRPLPMNRGVPQGSVLGPVLFILLTNDMPQYLGGHCTTLMYADDTTLLLAEKSVDNMAVNSSIAINMTYQYCEYNDLVVNTNKTKQIAFGKKRHQVPAIPEVEAVERTKFLGIIVDENLSWNYHIEGLTNKLNTCLYVLKRIKQASDQPTAIVAYRSLFESHIRYGLSVWGSTSARNLQQILLLQKKAIRILCELHFRDSCRRPFTEMKILTIVALYIREVVLYVDRGEQIKCQDIHSHNTRHGTNYVLPPHHSVQYEKKPSYIGIKIHNLLPKEIRSLQGKKLKTQLTEWLTHRPFYTLDEFLQWRKNDKDIFKLQ